MAKNWKSTDQFKAKAALKALRGDKTIQKIAAMSQVARTGSALGSISRSASYNTSR